MDSSQDRPRLGELGAGPNQNVVPGVCGATLTTTGTEKPGFGSTINPTVTAEKSEQIYFDLFIVLDSSNALFIFNYTSSFIYQ